MNKLMKFFVDALNHLRQEVNAQRNYVKPQFLMDGDSDEYQEALERSWDNQERVDPVLDEIDYILQLRDSDEGAFYIRAAEILKRHGYKITITKNW